MLVPCNLDFTVTRIVSKINLFFVYLSFEYFVKETQVYKTTRILLVTRNCIALDFPFLCFVLHLVTVHWEPPVELV